MQNNAYLEIYKKRVAYADANLSRFVPIHSRLWNRHKSIDLGILALQKYTKSKGVWYIIFRCAWIKTIRVFYDKIAGLQEKYDENNFLRYAIQRLVNNHEIVLHIQKQYSHTHHG
jgi:hypothetical protein